MIRTTEAADAVARRLLPWYRAQNIDIESLGSLCFQTLSIFRMFSDLMSGACPMDSLISSLLTRRHPFEPSRADSSPRVDLSVAGGVPRYL